MGFARSESRITEGIVNNIWILMAFWIGATLGFVVFAMMQIAREGCEEDTHSMRRASAAPPRAKSENPAKRFVARTKRPLHVE